MQKCCTCEPDACDLGGIGARTECALARRTVRDALICIVIRANVIICEFSLLAIRYALMPLSANSRNAGWSDGTEKIL